jgi:hypothetical protein
MSRFFGREMIAASRGQVADQGGCRVTFYRFHSRKVPNFGIFVE